MKHLRWIMERKSESMAMKAMADAPSVYAQIDMIRRIIPILLKSSLTHDVH